MTYNSPFDGKNLCRTLRRILNSTRFYGYNTSAIELARHCCNLHCEQHEHRRLASNDFAGKYCENFDRSWYFTTWVIHLRLGTPASELRALHKKMLVRVREWDKRSTLLFMPHYLENLWHVHAAMTTPRELIEEEVKPVRRPKAWYAFSAWESGIFPLSQNTKGVKSLEVGRWHDSDTEAENFKSWVKYVSRSGRGFPDYELPPPGRHYPASMGFRLKRKKNIEVSK